MQPISARLGCKQWELCEAAPAAKLLAATPPSHYLQQNRQHSLAAAIITAIGNLQD